MAAENLRLPIGMKPVFWPRNLIGEGGFGAIRTTEPADIASPAEVIGYTDGVEVLKPYGLAKRTIGFQRHFLFFEVARLRCFKAVMMNRVGKSIKDLNKGGPGAHMTMGCSLSVGMQALEALEDIHGLGYLHRDVKPGNYTIGRPELNELRKIYILDFGMCRKFANDQQVMRRPRQTAGFRGTVRYAPISWHLQGKLCRKDDVEGWFYMQIELTLGAVPWKEVQDMNQVGQFKQKVRNPQFINELFPPPCPREFIEILQHVDQCKYYDAPNYQQIYALMRKALASTGTEEFPYDWEMIGPSAHVSV